MLASGIPYIDFHSHSMWNGGDSIEVVSIHNQQVKDARFYTIGFHPWWTDCLLSVENISFLEHKYLYDPFCLGIGEFGLDNLKGVSIELQEQICLQQIQLANKICAPVIIHCVRAFDRLLRMKKRYGQTPWVIHGFVRNRILAGQILDAGIEISVAPDDKMSSNFIDMLTYVPLDRIFLETDSDFRMNIMDRYATFAKIRQIEVDELKQQLYHNFITFYSDKWKYHIG